MEQDKLNIQLHKKRYIQYNMLILHEVTYKGFFNTCLPLSDNHYPIFKELKKCTKCLHYILGS